MFLMLRLVYLQEINKIASESPVHQMGSVVLNYSSAGSTRLLFVILTVFNMISWSCLEVVVRGTALLNSRYLA